MNTKTINLTFDQIDHILLEELNDTYNNRIEEMRRLINKSTLNNFDWDELNYNYDLIRSVVTIMKYYTTQEERKTKWPEIFGDNDEEICG